MKVLQRAVLAVLLLAPVAAWAADADAARANAGEKTRQALHAYRQALEQELQQLSTWSKTIDPPGGDKLRDERAAAEQRLRQLGDEANRGWDGIRARMDAVVDDVKRRHQEAQVRR